MVVIINYLSRRLALTLLCVYWKWIWRTKLSSMLNSEGNSQLTPSKQFPENIWCPTFDAKYGLVNRYWCKFFKLNCTGRNTVEIVIYITYSISYLTLLGPVLIKYFCIKRWHKLYECQTLASSVWASNISVK